jgi:hemolysin-activating ACP:hemolysin acyltransferase
MTMPYVHVNSFNRDIWLKSLGQVITILLNSERKSVSIASVGAFVLPFAKLGQIKTFEGYNGFPSAYMTWGYLTEESLGILSANPSEILDVDELNAGDHLVIFDMISNMRDIRPMLKHIRYLAEHRYSHFYGIRFDKRLGSLTLRKYSFKA